MELGTIENSIERIYGVLTQIPNDHPELPHWHAQLGGSYANRFRCLRRPDDLYKAIRYTSLALAQAPDSNPYSSYWLNSLWMYMSCDDRSPALHNPDDIEMAVGYISPKLTALAQNGHPYLPQLLYNLLRSFHNRTQSSNVAPRAKFRYTMYWAALASRHTSLSLNMIEAYQGAIDLLPQCIWLGPTRGYHWEDLFVAGTLAINAFYAALTSSQHQLALEWLESARCIVWNQRIVHRLPLDELWASNPLLATRFQTIAKQLHGTNFQPQGSARWDMAEQVAAKQWRLIDEYNDLLTSIRQLPGFEDFLRPTKGNSLAHITRNGPIVVVVCSKGRCDALLIRSKSGDISHIPLPSFSEEKAKLVRLEVDKSCRSRGARRPVFEPIYEFQDTLVTLWYDIVNPILNCLGYTNLSVPRENMPHITWCPTGAMSFLPLHAAGDYDQPGARVFDYATSSYTPTLTALLVATTNPSNHDPRVLAIGQAATPGHAHLPGTVKELEYVKNQTKNKVEYSQLTGDHATTRAVLDGMGQYDWVHLACHAHQNVSDPTKSGFFLHDGILDLASISQRSFKSKGLAFLSACQTAQGDKRLPDEAIHLASGMLMAGYTSVIATMWSVMDEDAPLVANIVYTQLMKDRKLGNGEAGRALHYAVGELRERVGEREFARWVPWIHIGS